MVYKSIIFLLVATLATGTQAFKTPHFGTGGKHLSKYSRRSPFTKRDDYICSSDSDSASLMLTHFSAVFFGDFITSGGQDILGSLAVEGKFKASSYIVHANGDVDCSSDRGVDSYSLIVGGEVDASGVRVRGNAEVPAGSSGLQETVSSCSINSGTGIYDFNQAERNAKGASEILAGLKPTLYLDSNGKLSSISDASDDINVITMNTCNNGNCNLYPSEMSDASAFLEGIGNWNGPSGMSWPKTGTLVINVPIDVGSTFTISGNLVSSGINPCITIFNFYPSDSNGEYTSGTITLKRNTGSNFGGFSLAPEAHIIDGSTGAFSGTVVGKDYKWGSSGIEIHDYAAAGGSCTNFQGCLPITNGTIIITTTSTTSTTTLMPNSTTTIMPTTTTFMPNSTTTLMTTTTTSMLNGTNSYTATSTATTATSLSSLSCSTVTSTITKCATKTKKTTTKPTSTTTKNSGSSGHHKKHHKHHHKHHKKHSSCSPIVTTLTYCATITPTLL
ncbi:MAG: hypothetical protein EXX96DRAFT_541490 [Benjaminiella poitrasii]|nr:MAG: hypothetical protein EXX96DRAFT_541490 [Benjaminiella poitrasii]